MNDARRASWTGVEPSPRKAPAATIVHSGSTVDTSDGLGRPDPLRARVERLDRR